MAYDVELADRLRDLVEGEPGLSEKKMFGGLAFLVHGNMAVAASSKGGLLLRVDPDRTDELLEHPHAEPFEMQGRGAKGWLRIDPAGLASDDDLQRWTEVGLAYASSLPPK
ncbi:TfoX/Sxy family protein [Nocardioides sp. CN2-186]|uniref:TfoX/Sxy family protein n=1 Tax=Nocardioides tweenelious TaxID=3156607 RepID=UPI0032B37FE6